MKLKRHWPIVAALIAIVMLLVVWLRAPGPHVPVPLETNEGSSTIETALVHFQHMAERDSEDRHAQRRSKPCFSSFLASS